MTQTKNNWYILSNFTQKWIWDEACLEEKNTLQSFFKLSNFRKSFKVIPHLHDYMAFRTLLEMNHLFKKFFQKDILSNYLIYVPKNI